MVLFFYHPITYMGLGSTMMAFPFYIIGFFGKTKIDSLTQNRWKIIIAILLFLVSIPMTKLNLTISIYSVNFGHFPFLPLRLIFCYGAGVFCSLSVILLCSLFKQRSMVKEWADALITILCAQSLFNYIYRSHFDLTNYAMGAVTSAAFFLLCILIHKTIGKRIYLNKR